jgi:curli biogenesis system outer membrane secretion channel CsgG
MRRILSFVLLGFLALPLAVAQQKHRIAVMEFGYGTVMNSVQAMFGSNQDIGRGISDMLINQLVNDGTYRVIERQALDKLMQEQNFSNSDRANPATAAKLGALLGVDTIIIGDVTTFGRDDKNYGAGGAASSWDKYGIGNFGLHKSKAVVEITARMIDVNTGEILASVTGRGESKRNGTNLLGGGGSGWNSGSGSLDMSSTNFGQTIIGEATKASVAQIATGLDQKAANLPVNAAPAPAPINGLVADASTSDIIVNVGAKAGVKVGDTLAISRLVRTVKDPATGKVLRVLDSPVGSITVTSVDADSAVGRFTGSGKPQIGDIVKRAGEN